MSRPVAVSRRFERRFREEQISNDCRSEAPALRDLQARQAPSPEIWAAVPENQRRERFDQASLSVLEQDDFPSLCKVFLFFLLRGGACSCVATRNGAYFTVSQSLPRSGLTYRFAFIFFCLYKAG